LEGIRHLLSHLHGEVTALEESTLQVLRVLRKIEERGDRDDLTGLLRRGEFFRKWEELLAECSTAERECGVILLDIDHFKRINDEHGHPVGDEAIRRVSELLRSFEAPRCIAGRLGGEEFAVVVEGPSAELQAIAELI